MKKKLLYNVLLIFITIIILGIFELFLRVLSVGSNVNLFIKHPNKQYKEYYMVNPLIGEKYFSKFDATQGTNDIFLKKKPTNGFRVFLLGSSTLVGFPYDKNLMASRILQKRLEDAYPNKNIEVVNTAITAINSITLNDYMNEIVDYDADAILIYAGHNEFYGAYGIGSNETMSQNIFVRNLHLKSMNLRLYQLLSKAFIKIPTLLAKQANKGEAKGSLMKRIVADENIAYNGEKYKLGINQYVTNIESIITKANKKNIPVFISNLVCNVSSLHPLGNSDEAHKIYKLAKEAVLNGDSIQAIEQFYRAKDLDPIRFRASEEINKAIDSLADAHNCYYINTKETFQNSAKNGLIGNNLMTEHVHPNIEGQFLLAHSFYKGLIKSKIISAETSIYNLRNYNYYRNNWGYTKLDSLIGDYKVKQLKSYWPFTSLNVTTTFRDTFIPNDRTDSLAFSVLFKNKTEINKKRSDLADHYLHSEQYNKALIEYKALTAINPYWYNNYNKTAQCLLKLNDLNGAEKQLLKSLSYKPSHFAYLMLGEIEMIKVNLELAIIYYSRAAELAKDESQQIEVLKKLNMAYFHNSMPNKQKEILIKLKKHGVATQETFNPLHFSYSNYIPYNIKLHINKANKHIEENNIDTAISILFNSTFINDTPLANKMIGDLLYQKQQNNLLHFYNKAYNAYSKDPIFLHTYVIAHYVNKDKEGALRILNEFKNISTNIAEVEKLEKLINSLN